MAISVNQAKKILGSEFSKYSEEELEVILNELYSLADIVVGSTKIVRDIDSIKKEVENGN